MEIRILGAHNLETRSTRLSGILVDGLLQFDAGSLTSALTLEEQAKIQAIFITHRHFDHVRDLMTFALNTTPYGTTVVYSLASVLQDLSDTLLSGALYPKFTERPTKGAPKLRLVALEPGRPVEVAGYRVTAVPVPHNVPATGYEVESGGGRRVFYTGDTGGPLDACWRQTDAEVLITEVTFPNGQSAYAAEHGHMAPLHLQRELRELQRQKGRSPKVVVVHMSPPLEEEIVQEVATVARELGADIQTAHEDLRLTL